MHGETIKFDWVAVSWFG